MIVANTWHTDLIAPIKPDDGHAAAGTQRRRAARRRNEAAPAGTLGRVAVDSTAPLFAFDRYHNEPERTAQRFTEDGRWYLTGDVAMCDDEGSFFFSSRDDDMIIMAGYRIGPFDVESVLVAHDDVAEAAVIGVPDALKGEVIEAYVVPRGPVPSDEFTAELQQHVKAKFAAHAYPRRCIMSMRCPRRPAARSNASSCVRIERPSSPNKTSS